MKKAKWALVLVPLVAAATAFLLVHKRSSDRELIEQLITRLEGGVEQKKNAQVLACIAKDYEDESGLTKRDLTRLAFQYLRSSGRVDLLLADVKIEIHGRAAIANMYAEVTYLEGGMNTQPFAGKVTVFFRKEGRRWFIVKSEGWQSAAAHEAYE